MTNKGAYVCFTIGDPQYMAPEIFLAGPSSDSSNVSSPSSDVWSLGMIILELCLDTYIFLNHTLEEIVEQVSNLSKLKNGSDVIKHLSSLAGVSSKIETIPQDIYSFLEACFTPQAAKRPKPSDLLGDSQFLAHDFGRKSLFSNFLSNDLKCSSKNPVDCAQFVGNDLAVRSIHELYYLWNLTGRDIQSELLKQGLVTYRPPITSLPNLISSGCYDYPKGKDKSIFYHDLEIALSFDLFKQNLRNLNLKKVVPSYLPKFKENCSSVDFDLQDNIWPHIQSRLPPPISETDIEYQLRRFFIYERLLNSYPFTREFVIEEARKDIPPLYRPYVWAVLLNIKGDIDEYYDLIDKVTPSETDRQIEVDIPRCHQYDELLSSPQGHIRFKRLLKAWLETRPRYVYWQGLDSLCAPFIKLNFTNEGLAFACIQAFIDKYLQNFFLKDNSQVIQEYLAIFSHILAYHDIELFNHLTKIGFFPELYAIPWFLTMYTHVFPLDKIFHLWDTLLLGNSSFPLFIGLAILKQLRTDLLSFSFNECILLFSDLPDINIERCTLDAISFYNSTPPSAAFVRSTSPTSLSSELPDNEKAFENVSLAQLKSEFCPRITYKDALDLIEGKTSTFSKVIVIDVRPHSQFMQGTIKDAINMPFDKTFSPEGSFNPGPESSCLSSHKGHIVIIAGSQNNNDAAMFAQRLVNLGFPKVCFLHNGIESLRRAYDLVFPTL